MTLGLVAAGIRVLGTAARESGELQALEAEIRDRFGSDRFLPLTADVTHPEAAERTVATALEHWGRLDVLINNAGRGMKYVNPRFLTDPPPFWETPPELWRLIIDTNVNGPFFMAWAAVRPMLAQGWGRIINISMNRETMRRKGFSPYGPSKAAVESETAIWAQDLAGTGVTVNALLPGGASATGMIPPDVPEAIRAQLLPPEIMVPPLLWLVSRAADQVTGKRVIARQWTPHAPGDALEDAGWG
jgi:3-oxoacyl-[acyl-carrier protein] reductase